jgi:phage tail sheath protein FI
MPRLLSLDKSGRSRDKIDFRIPPSGAVAGIYARTDVNRGVHKAPANEKINGALDVQMKIGKGEQDVLNPKGINCIRTFPGRGQIIWGARTISDNTLWKYINVRRLFNYIEESIQEGTQWVVFEPNNEKLWARVRATITQFLTRVWMDGALLERNRSGVFCQMRRTTMSPRMTRKMEDTL